MKKLHCKTKVILTRENDFFGPGIYYLLKCIDETGSIHKAAAKMEMSYTKCCKLINRAEQEMKFPFLNRTNGGKTGGSSTLTSEGRLFIERYETLIREVEKAGQNLFETYFGEFR